LVLLVVVIILKFNIQLLAIVTIDMKLHFAKLLKVEKGREEWKKCNESERLEY
jgi:hypothetical protein